MGDGRARLVSRSVLAELRKGRGGGRKEKVAPTSGVGVSAAQKKKGSGEMGHCGDG
jgi:hypothetical protein